MTMKWPWKKLWFEDLDRDCGHLAPSTRGIWVWIFCDLDRHGGERSLTLAQWALVARATIRDIADAFAELIWQEVCDSSVTRGVTQNVTRDALSQNSDALITIRCRRIYREHKLLSQHALRQHRYRERKAGCGNSDAAVTGEKQKQKQNTSPKPPSGAENDVLKLPSVEAFKLAGRLRATIAARDPKAKAGKMDDVGAWAREIELLLIRDGRSQDDVGAVIDWCQQSWWGPHILSGRKLREKFDTMWGQMKGEKGNAIMRRGYVPDTIGAERPRAPTKRKDFIVD